MCFGDKLGETQIKKIEEVQRRLLLSSRRFAILNFFPSIGRILFRKRWEELFQLRRNQDDVLIPLIKARRKVKQERQSKMKEGKENEDEFVVSYVDTLLDLELPEEKRKLEDKEMVNLCSDQLLNCFLIRLLHWSICSCRHLLSNLSSKRKLFFFLRKVF